MSGVQCQSRVLWHPKQVGVGKDELTGVGKSGYAVRRRLKWSAGLCFCWYNKWQYVSEKEKLEV